MRHFTSQHGDQQWRSGSLLDVYALRPRPGLRASGVSARLCARHRRRQPHGQALRG